MDGAVCFETDMFLSSMLLKSRLSDTQLNKCHGSFHTTPLCNDLDGRGRVSVDVPERLQGKTNRPAGRDQRDGLDNAPPV